MGSSSSLDLDWSFLRDGVVKAARLAGEAILEVRRSAVLGTSCKIDGSPVTLADQVAHGILMEALLALTPSVPLISEEAHPSSQPQLGELAWVVDPLDATKNFISGGVHFTVNIALVHRGIPVLGVIYAPALDDLFYGDPVICFRFDKGRMVPLEGVSPSAPPYSVLTNSAEKKWLPFDHWHELKWVSSCGNISGAYKFGMLAAHYFDFYPRTAPSFEWDCAAGDALLRCLGGGIVTADGRFMTYGKPDFLNPPFLAFAAPIDPCVCEGVLGYLKVRSREK